MTARTRMAVVVASVVFAGIAVLIIVRRGDRKASTRAAASGEMAGMAGMEGMNAGPSDGSVQLTANQLREFGITFGSAEVRALRTDVRTTGVVAFDETRMTQFSARVSGFAERLHVNATGQAVARGQPLLDVYSPELVAAQEELLVARRLQQTVGETAVPGIPMGTTSFEAAARRRLLLWDISASQIDEVLRSGVARRTLTLHAGSSGVVVEKRVVQGQSFQAGEPLYVLADLSRVWVDVELRENDVSSIRPGSEARIEFAGMPGRAINGRVEYIYPTVQKESRTVRARVSVANASGSLKPGMYATVQLSSPGRAALSVPQTAVIRTGERAIVFVDMGAAASGRTLMPHEVEVGRDGGEFVEILSGLEAGQRVVTSAQFLLESESNIADVMRSMIGQMGAGDVGTRQSMPGMDMNDMGADVRPMPEVKRPAPPERSMPGMKMPAPAARPPR